MYNYSLPKCSEDPLVEPTAKSRCPEFQQPNWALGISGPPRNDTRILLSDPRDGPLLPFAWADNMNSPLWNIGNNTRFEREWLNCTCCSMKECWEDVWMTRHSKVHMVKMFHTGGERAKR